MADDSRGGGDRQPKDPAATSLTINEVLMVVDKLPYLVLPEWYLPSEAEKEVLDSMQRNYRAEAKWLDGYFVGNNPDISDSDPALEFAYGSAVLERRLYDICLELVARGAVGGVTTENRSYAHLFLWGQLIVSKCRWTLKETNIPNMGGPNIRGKEADCKARSQAISAYSFSEKTRKHQRKSSGGDSRRVKLLKVAAIDTETEFWHWLHGQAWKLAKQDRYFRDNFWEPYLTAFASLNNAIKESESLQMKYVLPDDSVFTTRKGTRPPKGFGQKKC